ncbi:MAG TPA: exodeoxyribonuclease VII large subunit [Candidatus Cloacimonadota bacterium]|nr:exodeoxyribonuclease VII large subunit [Candidatus Cloacimonadota bacterium]
MNSEENIFTVTEINRHLKNVLENMVGNLLIEGEIANFTHHSSGHKYFSLKDEYSTIKCVFFKTYNHYIKFSPKNGDKVVCGGKVSVYEPQGTYQIQVLNMYQSGTGELQKQFEALKKKLFDEGLFAEEHKKSIPAIPQTIGIITSESGAALQDVLNVISRRYPIRILLYPAIVQGDKAAQEIIKGLQYFNEKNNVDVILITRGGGSQEDLFCFNDELLAREIFKSKIPTVSAVGHEIDFTISDFVADLRAPTPSAAAEILVPDRQELLENLKQKERQIKKLCLYAISQQKNTLHGQNNKMQQFHPIKKIYVLQQKLDQHSLVLMRIPNAIQKKSVQLHQLQTRLMTFEPRNIIMRHKQKILEAQSSLFAFKEKFALIKNSLILRNNKLQQMLQAFYQFNMSKQRQKIDQQNSQINLLLNARMNSLRLKLQKKESVLNEYAPKRALEKGYALIFKEKEFVNSVKQLKERDKIDINLKDGLCKCSIDKIEEY